jgi:hypothetical protein
MEEKSRKKRLFNFSPLCDVTLSLVMTAGSVAVEIKVP